MRLAIVGCGYVFDHYMSTLRAHPELEVVGVYDRDLVRAGAVSRFYGLQAYGSLEALLSDATVEMVLNFTSIESHYDVTAAALEAGRHVYSEKPITADFHSAKALFDLADRNGLVLASAPSNLFSDSVQTMWKAVRDGAIGTPLLAYAEFDDNPIYLMKPEGWRSRTGAPWPYIHEYEQGCTVEHAGYHLVWLCAILGPADSVTAFSKQLVADKTDQPLNPPDTPDFSVGCINFRSGAVARITCSIVAPADHRMRIVGNEGEIATDTYRHYQSPVTLERFSALSLNARKARSVRLSPLFAWFFGVGGRNVPLATHCKSHATRLRTSAGPASFVRNVISSIKRRQVGAQDKMLGVALTAQAIRENQPSPLPRDFLLHVTELTLAIQQAGTSAGARRLETSFEPLAPLPETLAAPNYLQTYRSRFLEKRVGKILDRLHRH